MAVRGRESINMARKATIILTRVGQFALLFCTFLLASDSVCAQQTIMIVSPVTGTRVAPGQTLTVQVSTSPQVSFSAVQLIGENIGVTSPKSSQPYSFALVMPNDIIGLKKLTALGVLSPENAVFSPSIVVDLESNANAIGLSVNFTQIRFRHTGQELSLVVRCDFDDGSNFDITKSSLISYSVADNSVASVDSAGLVTAVGPGSTNVTARYGNQAAQVQIFVPKSKRGDLNADGQINQDDLNIVLAALSTPATGPTDARDLNGDGTIDIMDANILVALCTQPCGIPASYKVPPATTIAAVPQPNGAEWNNSDITLSLVSTGSNGGAAVKQITYSATGAQSIATTVVPGASTSFAITTEGITTITFFGTDNAGNVERAKTLTIRLDKTAPSISCSAPDGLWHASDVTILCTASDVGSGLANPPDASFSLNTSVPAETETSNAATGTRSICDVAGNCATAGPVTGNMVDKKPPTISISSPTAGGNYLLNQAVNANYGCADGGSGVATCTGTVASGSPLSTAHVGSKTLIVNGIDKVGNIGPTQSVSYSVTYGVCLLYDPTRAVQSGSTIPLKIQLCDANNADVSSSTVVVHAVSLVQTSTNASEVLQASGNANPDNDFRFDPTLGPTGGYIFNLSTKVLTTGSYQLTFTASVDPLPHVLNFQVR